MISDQRITQTWIGYAITAVLFVIYCLLLTSSTTGEWFSYYLPAIAGTGVLALFAAAIAFKARIPQLPSISWLSIIIGAGYFFTRAWFSPDFYGSIEDMLPIAFGLIFYVAGIHIGISRTSHKLLFAAILIVLIANVILLNDISLFNKSIVAGRPSQSLLLHSVSSTGTFGYENFTSQFLAGTSFFCIAYFIFSGIRSWPWCVAGIIGCIGALQISGSRSVYSNLLLGALICWLFIVIKSQSKPKIFIPLCIISILGLLSGLALLFSIISQNPNALDKLSAYSNSSTRFFIFSNIPKIVESAPFIGHGAQSFPHLAFPFIPYNIIPNMAHNEYAQAIADYGLIGLSIMIVILAVHLFMGARLLLRPSILPEQKAIYAGAFTLLVIMCFHAGFDFIWHNAALTAGAGFCLGILATSRINHPKAGGRVNKYGLLGICTVLMIGLAAFARMAFPIWDLSWKMNALPPFNKNNPDTEHIDLLKEAVSIAGDSFHTNRLAHAIIDNPILSTPENCRFLIDNISKSLVYSPLDDLLKTSLGRAYDKTGDFEKAEALLFPYTNPLYYNGYAWKAIYYKHLGIWAESLFGRDNRTALSILLEMEKIYPFQRAYKIRSKKQTEFIKELLLKKGITPDDSWKKNRFPATFPTPYGPALPELAPIRS